ncbi:aminopeptidase [Tilletia horrida]|nr:aminopeptidase [Tilletia horrida]
MASPCVARARLPRLHQLPLLFSASSSSCSASASCCSSSAGTGSITNNVPHKKLQQGPQQQQQAVRAYSSAAASAASAAASARHATFKKGGLGGEAIGGTGSSRTSRVYGQPLPHTHPHLFPRRSPGEDDLMPATLGGPHNFFLPTTDGTMTDPGLVGVAYDELTPGITAAEYEARRRTLMASLPDSSIVVAMSGRVKIMSGNIFYRFRQETNFWYLTGFQEPDAALIMEKNSGPRGYKMTLFVQARDEHNETWNGPRTGIDGAQDIFGADEALEMDPTSLLSHLKQILPQYTHIYVEPPNAPTNPRTTSASRSKPNILNFLAPPSPTGYDVFPKKSDFEAVVKLLGDTRRCHSLAREVERFRVRKSPAEIRAMRRAADVSAAAMVRVMGYQALHRARHGASTPVSEAQLQATFEYECALRGAQRPAYVPVVASGANACTIHYVNNDNLVGPGQAGMVCIDAGCELDGYASDITRAFPVGADLGGRFNSAQRDLYEAVLSTLKAVTALVSAQSGYSLSELHRRSVELLRQELNAIGGFQLGHDVLERSLFPHYIGHFLGIDLHDTSSIPRSTRLEEGMVITVEPGLYVSEGDARFPKAFWGLGIRVEDDVLVQATSQVVLSANAPKEVADVEAICQGFFEPEIELRRVAAAASSASGEKKTRRRSSASSAAGPVPPPGRPAEASLG